MSFSEIVLTSSTSCVESDLCRLPDGAVTDVCKTSLSDSKEEAQIDDTLGTDFSFQPLSLFYSLVKRQCCP